ncbi:clavesin-2-like [Anopheles ziemanni]|uniref:clavesin-2-like n=1 Tax=Anopheles coustani TaxID=139045 RepID=UPI002659CE83|nr:clavesin-2-like [Anopheles coustani]XP_058167230.1 clavesin-2-like [Anopheles ziemanni]
MVSPANGMNYSIEKRPESYDKYEFSLPEQYRKMAKEELREDDEIREHSLAQMREWIAKHPYIRKCRTDAPFLLRFLRFRKFSVPTACEALERYLAMRSTFPEWFKNLDCDEPMMKGILQDGLFTKLGVNREGRMVILFKPRVMDPNKYLPIHQGRMIALLIEAMLEWEELQIGGFHVLIDFSDTVLKLYTSWGVTDMMIFMDAVSHSFPIRIREVNGVKFPKFGVAMINALLSFASAKLKQRVVCFKTEEEFKARFDPELLITDYGGSLDQVDLLRHFRKRLEDRRSVMLALDEMDIDVERYSSLWTRPNLVQNEVEGGVMGSFRKLNVD